MNQTLLINESNVKSIVSNTINAGIATLLYLTIFSMRMWIWALRQRSRDVIFLGLPDVNIKKIVAAVTPTVPAAGWWYDGGWCPLWRNTFYEAASGVARDIKTTIEAGYIFSALPEAAGGNWLTEMLIWAQVYFFSRQVRDSTNGSFVEKRKRKKLILRISYQHISAYTNLHLNVGCFPLLII